MKTRALIMGAMFIFGCDDASKATAAASGGAPAVGQESAPAAKTDGFQSVPNISGMRAKVPANAVPNGIGGAAGFHSEDGSYGFDVVPVEVQDETLEQAKEQIAIFGMKKWIKSDKTDDGWVLVWEAPKLVLEGEEFKEVGTIYSFEVRKKVGEQQVKCYGSVPKEENVAEVLKSCESLQAG